jgi:RNase P/RNase MRP subunit p29
MASATLSQAPEKALRLVLSLNQKQDDGAVRASAVKPFLLDVTQRPTRSHDHPRATRRKQRVKRHTRHSALTSLRSVQLERALSLIWEEHVGSASQDVVELSHALDLTGCQLVVVSRQGDEPQEVTEGVVVKESSEVLHLSRANKQQVFVVPKRGSVFRCSASGVEFRRACWLQD